MDRDRYSRLSAKGASSDSHVTLTKSAPRHGARGRGPETSNHQTHWKVYTGSENPL